MIDNSDNTCIICQKAKTEYHHPNCHQILSSNNFKDCPFLVGSGCFICNKDLEINEPFCSYENNNFVKFHHQCLEKWHQSNNIQRYDEQVFGIKYPPEVDHYYLVIENTYHKVKLDDTEIYPYPIETLFEEHNKLEESSKVCGSTTYTMLLIQFVLVIIVFIYNIFN